MSLSHYFAPKTMAAKMQVPEDVYRTHPFYINVHANPKDQESMDDYLARVLGTTKSCKVNSLLYELVDAYTMVSWSKESTKQMRGLMVKLKSTIVHGLYQAQVADWPYPDFVQRKEWPQIMSFAPTRLSTHNKVAVPIPYSLARSQEIEYSNCIMHFYKQVQELEGVEYTPDSMHLHKFGWLRHSETDKLVMAAKKLTKGTFETLRDKALKALDHVLGLGITELIWALQEVDTDELNTQYKAPLQQALSKDVVISIKNRINDLFFQCNDWIVDNCDCGIFYLLDDYADGRLRFTILPVHSRQKWDLPDRSSEEFAKIHKPLNRLIFGLMMYGGTEYFTDGDFYNSDLHCVEIGFRRDHINIGFLSTDDIQISVYRCGSEHGNKPGRVDMLLRIVRTTKGKLDETLTLRIDATSTIGMFMLLLYTLGIHAKAPSFFFHMNDGEPCRHTIALYKTMRRYYNVPAGQGGTIAARITKATDHALKKAEDVCEAGELTEDIIQKETNSARSSLHNVQQHQKYAARGAKRRALHKLQIPSDSESEDLEMLDCTQRW